MDASINTALHLLSYALEWFNSIPGHWLFTAGVVLASIPLTTVLIQQYKHLHLKLTATELTNHGIDFVLIVTSTLMAVSDFLLTNSGNLGVLFPFLAVTLPMIKAWAPSVYTYSKAINGYLKSHPKPLFAAGLPDLKPLVEDVTTPAPAVAASPVSKEPLAAPTAELW